MNSEKEQSAYKAKFISTVLRFSIWKQNNCKLKNSIQQRFLPFCWGLKCRLSDQKCPETGLSFIQIVTSRWLQRF